MAGLLLSAAPSCSLGLRPQLRSLSCLQGCPSALLWRAPAICVPSLSTRLTAHSSRRLLSQKQFSSLAWQAAFRTSNTPLPSQREGQLLFFLQPAVLFCGTPPPPPLAQFSRLGRSWSLKEERGGTFPRPGQSAYLITENSLEMDREPKSYLWDCGRESSLSAQTAERRVQA